MRDPVRPDRARRPPDRRGFASLALAAADGDLDFNLEIHSHRLPKSAMHVDIGHGADRIVTLAFDLLYNWKEVLMLADACQLRDEFDAIPHKLQRAPPETHFLGANIYTAPSRHVPCGKRSRHVLHRPLGQTFC